MFPEGKLLFAGNELLFARQTGSIFFLQSEKSAETKIHLDKRIDNIIKDLGF
jgi:hypothetical protein